MELADASEAAQEARRVRASAVGEGRSRRPVLAAGASAGPSQGVGPVGGPSQVEQVRALRVVELQCAGQGVKDGRGRAGEGAAFQLGVVLDADPRQRRCLTAPQSGDAAVTDVRQARLLRGDSAAAKSGTRGPRHGCP